jgi:integrase
MRACLALFWQALYTKKLQEGLSPTTVRSIHLRLHHALKDALRLGLAAVNVSEKVSPPRAAHHEMQTLSEEQARQFLQAAAGERFYVLYVLALTTGMREGELLALRWQDVDLEQALLQVRLTIQESRRQGEHGNLIGMYILVEPKTAKSRRRISLAPIAVSALRAHRKRQNEERLRLGPAWDTTYDLVFPNSIGRLMDPRNFLLLFRRILTRAGLPRLRFHDLRHTAATLLLRRGINPKVVAEMLGHASVRITLDIYSHVTPDMQETAAMVMEAVFGGS